MLLLTNKDAPRYRLATIDLADPSHALVDVVPQDADALLKDALAVPGGHLLLVYQRNVQDEVYLYSRAGKRLQRLAPDHVGSASVSGKQHRQDQVFLTLSGFTTPGTVKLYDFAQPAQDRALVPFRTTVLKGLNPAEFAAEQVWYASADGTRVPMFVVRHAGTPRDGTAPAIQYGYGGFDISITPAFTPHVLTVLKHYGAVYAVANIRGGGEFGEEWHQGGMREKKVGGHGGRVCGARG
jgi:prolyl oligopeptidase